MCKKGKETMEQLIKRVEKLESRLRMLATGQRAIIEHFSEDNKEFFIHMLSSFMANKEIRNDFTEYVNENADDDDIKIFMTEMNEIALDIDKKVDDE
jgi:aldehyde:ferredoxin oxidoreductase